jgi:hypothetical protein
MYFTKSFLGAIAPVLLLATSAVAEQVIERGMQGERIIPL